jgi:hypothetical protein
MMEERLGKIPSRLSFCCTVDNRDICMAVIIICSDMEAVYRFEVKRVWRHISTASPGLARQDACRCMCNGKTHRSHLPTYALISILFLFLISLPILPLTSSTSSILITLSLSHLDFRYFIAARLNPIVCLSLSRAVRRC